jgi:DNA-binding response OmpR family regulator
MSKRILIVDDEPNIVISLEFLMKREGYQPIIATDGEAALKALAEQAPDLVILDVMLPKLNGFEVCRLIRADERWRSIRILMLTAKGRDTEVAKGLGLGADAYVTKPFSTRDLVALVKQLLGQAA